MNGGSATTDIGTALMEIAKALNRIADKMPSAAGGVVVRAGGGGGKSGDHLVEVEGAGESKERTCHTSDRLWSTS